MEVIVLKTHEIDISYWNMIVDGFNSSFEGRCTTIENLIQGASSNHFGYSFHAICIDGERVAGFNTIAPSKYFRNETETLILGLSGTSFVVKEYRKNEFILYDMHMALKKYCQNEGLTAFLGVPNDNAYKYVTKWLGYEPVMNLPYRVLPIKIFKVLKKHNLLWLNFLSQFFSFVLLLLNSLICLIDNQKQVRTKYHLDLNNDYLEKRFVAKRYTTLKSKNKRFTYNVVDEDGVRAAYIMDFRESGERSYQTLVYIVWKIILKENVDIILFVGALYLRQGLLIKVPQKFEPKRLPLTFHLLKSDEIEKYSDMKYPGNWDFSLINLDVR